MLESNHHMIFYPEDPQVLSKAVEPRKGTNNLHRLPAAILVPHASYDHSLEALHRSFGETGSLNPELVVFLGPLHQEVLTIDEPAFLFTSASSKIRIAGRNYCFASSLMDELVSKFSPSLAQEDSYLSEESAFELTLPLIGSYFPDCPVLVLLAGSCSASQIKTYAQILDAIVKAQEKTLFIVSANANALLSSPQAEEHAQAFVSALTEEGNLMDLALHHQVSSCNLASLIALSQLPWAEKRWNITSYFCKAKEHETIEVFSESKDKHVWHLSGYWREINA